MWLGKEKDSCCSALCRTTWFLSLRSQAVFCHTTSCYIEFENRLNMCLCWEMCVNFQLFQPLIHSMYFCKYYVTSVCISCSGMHGVRCKYWYTSSNLNEWHPWHPRFAYRMLDNAQWVLYHEDPIRTPGVCSALTSKWLLAKDAK